jgi:hypothetical protein
MTKSIKKCQHHLSKATNAIKRFKHYQLQILTTHQILELGTIYSKLADHKFSGLPFYVKLVDH